MGRYVTFQDVQDRYAITLDEGALSVESTYIYYAENELDSLLAPYFTVPFSSDNATAKDLAIDLTYFRISNFKVTERKEFKEMIMERIQRIIEGTEKMITGGDPLASVGNTVYSTTMDYLPAFSMLDDIDQHVDKNLLEDQANERDYR